MSMVIKSIVIHQSQKKMNNNSKVNEENLKVFHL